MTHSPDPVLVLGGTGKTGRRVADRLAGRGVTTRIGSRAGEPPFDWNDRATWVPVLSGIRAAYLSYHPDLAVPGAAETVGALAAQAVGLGVDRLVLLSGRGEEEAQHAEQLVRAASPGTTIVRASWFAQNFSEGAFRDEIAGGVLTVPVGDVPEPFVDVDDIADVATAALLEPGHAGRLYEVTGPRLLTFADALADIAAATGRVVRLQRVGVDAYAEAMTGYGLPADDVALLTYLFGEVLDGRNAMLADGVEQALGRPPRDFRTYAREAAAAGAWDRSSVAG